MKNSESKLTPSQEAKRKRNEKIKKRYKELINDGYAIMRAYNIISEEYEVFSIMTIRKILKD